MLRTLASGKPDVAYVLDAKAESLSKLDRLPFGCRVTGAAVQEAEPSMAGESSTLTVVSALIW